MTEVPQPYSIYEDPVYKRLSRELRFMLPRFIVNSFFTATDLAPGYIPGESGSVVADGSKILRLGVNFLGFRLRFFDPTPDVDGVAFYTEGIEVFGGGTMPTHAIESLLQLNYDRQRLMRYGRVRWMAFRGTDHGDIKEYLYGASKNDRLMDDLLPKEPVPLSDLSAQEILDLVPKPLL